MKIDKLIRSKRRSIGLQIGPDATLIVRAPDWAKMPDIKEVVVQHADWIQKKQTEASKEQHNPPIRHFVAGEEFPYLGKYYKLHITSDTQYALTFDEAFYLSAKYQQVGSQVFKRWYKLRAKYIISQRVQLFATRTNLHYGRIGITNASKRWGSCSYKGNLNFAWRLVLAPIESVDYVIAHELAHLEVKNHSKRFWDRVETIYPGYEQYRKWLREHGRFLTI
jgi:predicted metal-dependent hydrolase